MCCLGFAFSVRAHADAAQLQRSILTTLRSLACLTHDNFDNHRLPFSNQGHLTPWELGKQGEFLALHRRFNSAQGLTTNQYLVRGEDQSQALLLLVSLQF